MLMEKLFSQGVMTMGPSGVDPARQVGVFNPDFVSGLAALRAEEMEKVRWLVGEWSHENTVPATRFSPAYTDIGSSRFRLCEKNTWLCSVTAENREIPRITFDPFSKQWLFLLMQGSYGILRSRQGWGPEGIEFFGLMTMLGINCEWRMTWTRKSTDEFGFVNEERDDNGVWRYIDEWQFKRKR